MGLPQGALPPPPMHPSAMTPVPAPPVAPYGMAPQGAMPLAVAGPVIVHSKRSPVLTFVLIALALILVAGALGVAWYLHVAYAGLHAQH
jgi:hypothetical protein